MLFYSDSLYWTDFYLNNQPFRMMIDTGSNLITVADNNCPNCQNGARLSTNLNNNLKSASYGGGQQINYNNQIAFADQLNQNVDVSVVQSGNNPDGKILNILGLMNKSLKLQSLIIDFPGNAIYYNSGITPSLSAANLLSLPYLAIGITGIPNVHKIILDTGTNYVLTNQPYPNGFTFAIGNKMINVDNSVIKHNDTPDAPDSIILGNMVMSQYRWEIDFVNNKVYIY